MAESHPEAYSVFEYLYRDASNNTAWGSVLLVGAVNPEDVDRLTACLVDASLFVAEQVGVSVLYEPPSRLLSDGGKVEDDRALHQFFALRAATPEEICGLTARRSIENLLCTFDEAKDKWRWSRASTGQVPQALRVLSRRYDRDYYAMSDQPDCCPVCGRRLLMIETVLVEREHVFVNYCPDCLEIVLIVDDGDEPGPPLIDEDGF